jgi:hypothetical protein
MNDKEHKRHMNIIMKYKIAVVIVLPVLILTAVRTFSITGFKYDAEKWSAPSFGNSNIVSIAGLHSLPGNRLMVNLDRGSETRYDDQSSEVNVKPDEVLNGKFLRLLRYHKGPVILVSSDPTLSARVWMVISQTGCRNIFILMKDADNESFKSKFRPDTLISPGF